MIIRKPLSVIFILFVLLMNIGNISYGNAAEPPSLMIIVANAPEDLEISIGKDDTYTDAKVIDKVIEKYYYFYYRDTKEISDYILNVKTNNLEYEVSFEKPLYSYQNIYSLNLDSQTLIPGKSMSRSITLVSMRIIITLIIEGIVFWLFAFRQRRSWKIFLIINLITQGALNIWINSLFPIQSYLFIGLIFLELLILIAESIVILLKIKEHRKGRKLLYVISANLLSLVAGGYILTILPF
ncbi:MAG: hypothetical protein GX231_06730 [Tissierellia bacterium]|nr:hypothetical protein [Tissierellia bacterium]